jgi:RNA polymerase sigma-70 factor (ECF subfamily)
MSHDELEALYSSYGFAVQQRCLRLLRDRAEADDAVQEVFLRVQRYGGPKTEASTLAWLYRVADRHCFDRLDRRKRSLRRHQPEEALESVAGPSDPARARLVAQVLEACPSRVREVAVLYYLDEMTQEEVATAVGYSRKTVKEKLAQFLETARRTLSVARPSAPEKEKCP